MPNGWAEPEGMSYQHLPFVHVTQRHLHAIMETTGTVGFELADGSISRRKKDLPEGGAVKLVLPAEHPWAIQVRPWCSAGLQTGEEPACQSAGVLCRISRCCAHYLYLKDAFAPGLMRCSNASWSRHATALCWQRSLGLAHTCNSLQARRMRAAPSPCCRRSLLRTPRGRWAGLAAHALAMRPPQATEPHACCCCC